MLENSFIHLPGIGAETERKFWELGVHTWDHLEDRLLDLFSQKRASHVAGALNEGREAAAAGEYAYFQDLLKGADMWRLVPAMIKAGHAEDIAYLDIETTGLGFPPECESTTIAVLFRGELFLEHTVERKRTLIENLQRDAKLLVTFNGGTFDLPFLRREFGFELRHPHLDLRYWMRHLGHRGGLKRIQKKFFDVIPQRAYMDIDGYDAVRLWRLHKRGVPNALESLFTYNAEDTLVLEHLVFHGLNLEAAQRAHLALPVYNLPGTRAIPYEVCEHVYRMLRG